MVGQRYETIGAAQWVSGRRTSGSPRPSLGPQGLALCSGKPQFQKSLGIRMEVPDTLLSDAIGAKIITLHNLIVSN